MENQEDFIGHNEIEMLFIVNNLILHLSKIINIQVEIRKQQLRDTDIFAVSTFGLFESHLFE